MSKILPRPDKYDSDMWVDEAIWGHRLYDEQTPWLCYMEFLNVLNAELEAGRAFVEDIPNSLVYSPQSRLYLRNILFNNPRMVDIERRHKNDPNTQWLLWRESMSDSSETASDYKYLESRFGSFEEFKEVVEFLCSSTIEGENNKRWSSQFIFPFGPECLYEDLKIRDGKASPDRRFFARTGELLYLMLTRSGKGGDLLPYFKERILRRDARFNRLVTALQPEEDLIHSTTKKRGGMYLPYLQLPEYQAIANDWIRLFECRIPSYDVIPYMVNIMGLHMILYSLNRSKYVLGQEEKVDFVIEIVAPKRTVIRELSADSFSENNLLSRMAIENLFTKFQETEEWKVILENNDLELCREVLNREFGWPKKEQKQEDFEGIETVQKYLKTLIDNTINRHKQHLNKFHNIWSREIGLSSRRGSRRSRYAPQDLLLKTLVLCVVPVRMEYQEFLQSLYINYGLIIGDKQANEYIISGRADQEAFSENALRLEQRLASMGLLKRLSDACAYVENPFANQGENNL